jgi:hypothetical protein
MNTQLKLRSKRLPELRLIDVVTDKRHPSSGKHVGDLPPSQRVKLRRQRAMRSLLWGALLLGLLHLGLTGLLETSCPHWRDPEFGHRLHRLQRLQKAIPTTQPLVIILGTSRAQNGLQPSAMMLVKDERAPLVFNCALTGSPPLKVLLTLHRLLDAGIVPDAILVEVLPLWLTSDAPAEQVFERTSERLSWSDLRHLRPYCVDYGELHREWLKQRLTPWSTQRLILKSHWCPHWLPWSERVDPFWTGMMDDGFMPFLYVDPSVEFRQRSCEHARREYAYAFGGFTFGQRSIQALAELVSLCRQKGIAVAWVEAPTSPQFRSWFAPGVWERGRQDMLDLAEQWHVPVFRADLDIQEEEFADGHHLLRQGASRYSRWLAEHHLYPWLFSLGLLPYQLPQSLAQPDPSDHHDK